MEKISLSLLTPNPHNGRKVVKVEELAASVKIHGVIEPIIVRKKRGTTGQYEIVAGSRRFEAAKVVGLKDIPAVIMELTDEEAYEVSIIENLQRLDLAPYEEAESFAAFLKGKDAMVGAQDLSEKLGVRVGYVLSRASAMSTPEPVLKAWQSGKIGFGHVQQIMRVRDEKMMKAVLKEALETRDGERASVVGLKRYIDKMSVDLKDGLFDKAGCASCDKCSVVQRKLFGIEDDDVKCNNRECFVKQQTVWLKDHWRETPAGKRLKTNTAVIDNGHMYGGYESFYDATTFPKKCAECVHFGSIVDVNGKPAQYGYGRARVCFGDKSCFSAAKKSADALTRGKTAKAKGDKAKKADPNAPRVEWHGAYFREQLYKTKLPEAFGKWTTEVPVSAMKIILACLVHTNRDAAKVIGLGLAVKAKKPGYLPGDYDWVDEPTIIAKVMSAALSVGGLDPIFKKAIAAVVMEGNENFKSSQGFGVKSRRMVADYLGINLKKEWVMTQEYMDKKTTKEIVAIIDKFKFAEDKKFQDYLVRKVKKDSLAKCKKSELVDLVLKSGVKLAGLVPDEILRKEA
jgi:ParB family transcriptional regulator, chromosome partitioning protein